MQSPLVYKCLLVEQSVPRDPRFLVSQNFLPFEPENVPFSHGGNVSRGPLAVICVQVLRVNPTFLQLRDQRRLLFPSP